MDGLKRQITLGSLFDGSGGFPLGGILNGIRTVWASEIEPFAIRVTKTRLPEMKHLGSVTKINGAEIEPVDIITFGSPCQDLSVAGKQKGIHDGERSNLFFEAIRIIKEMRNATANQFPRWAVWENVPGAFSSNKGEDFRSVLQALCEAGGGTVSIPRPAGGKWLHAGTVVGDGYSIAWRVYDAQYWGVPQRRKRIYLIADFGSERAGEVLFKSEGVSGDYQPGREAWERIAHDAARGAGGSDPLWNLKGNFIDRDTRQNGGGWSDGAAYTLDTTDHHGIAYPVENHAHDSRCNLRKPDEPCQTLASNMGMGGQRPACYVRRCYQNTWRGWWNGGEIAETLRTPVGGDSTKANLCVTSYGGNGRSRTGVAFGIDQQGGKGNAGYAEDLIPALCSDSHGTPHAVCYAPNGNYCGAYTDSDISATLQTRYHYGGGGDAAMVVYPERCRTLTQRYDSSPCVDRGQEVIVQMRTEGTNE